MRVGLLQLNPIIGDVDGNTLRVIDAARNCEADLLITPELVISGYPPRDLLLCSGFVEACQGAIETIAKQVSATMLIGHPRRDVSTGRFRNSVSVIEHGEIVATVDKQLLPGYDIFDEDRYFEHGISCGVVDLEIGRIGIAICEDFWRGFDATAAPSYDINPIASLVEAGCEFIVSPSASPFVAKKRKLHLEHALNEASENKCIVVMVNQVGGNDDLIFDGGSFVMSPLGLIENSPLFIESTIVVDAKTTTVLPMPEKNVDEARFEALVLGVRDYCEKTGHKEVVVGVSGGIDSALVATIATAALGPSAVTGVLMPSRFSSLGSIDDAEELASNLGIGVVTIPIEHIHSAFEQTHSDADNEIAGIALENAQARIRGLLLMSLANQNNALLLATGNKSELAVGYSTLYGDMCGAVSVIGDLYKTEVWDMSRWINKSGHFDGSPIPENSITKPPSAELRPDQIDEDSLPPYEDLDAILRPHIDGDLGADDIEETTQISRETIDSVIALVDRSQFKRDQASVILKVSPRTFGRGRPMPIVMKRRWSNQRQTT
ncbi:MAG: NAD+ synthase [Phycisphaerales bacterium]|jgi:NAD+ synthase (glutamine-hydrolysing)|nr:NAD+ synthase [Phycisphaerales bacterium]